MDSLLDESMICENTDKPSRASYQPAEFIQLTMIATRTLIQRKEVRGYGREVLIQHMLCIARVYQACLLA
jgi:hypothetical protein